MPPKNKITISVEAHPNISNSVNNLIYIIIQIPINAKREIKKPKYEASLNGKNENETNPSIANLLNLLNDCFGGKLPYLFSAW